MQATPRVVDAVQRLKNTFLEEPTTPLSLADATRVAGIEPSICQVILEALEDARFVARQNGAFVRRVA